MNGSEEYRYGFNGQEHDNELNENIYTAEFWEYDSRSGRRWNLDPKPRVGLSDYATFLNNPIWFNDVDGDTPDEPDPTYKRGKSGDNLGGKRFVHDDIFSKYFGIGWSYPSYVAQALNFAEATGGIIEGTNWKGSTTNNPQTFKSGSTVVVKLSSSSEIITGTIKILKDVYKIEDAQLNKIIESTPFTFTQATDYSNLFYYSAPSVMLNKTPIVGTLPPMSVPVAIPIIPPVSSGTNTTQGSLVVVTNTISTELAASYAQVYNLLFAKEEVKVEEQVANQKSKKHTTTKSKSKRDKHTKKRPGERSGDTQNNKKRTNKKFKQKVNPNIYGN